MRGYLEHFAYRNLSDHHSRMQRYAALMAQALYNSGKRCGLGKVLLNPQWRFVRGYVLRLGFLDGVEGLIYHLNHSVYIHWKYVKAWDAQKAKGSSSSATEPVRERN